MELSVVIPAFNEVDRLPPFLAAVRGYLDAGTGGYEVVVADDGSRDGTADAVRRLAAGWSQLRLVQLPANRGKGAALRAGVRAAGGRLILLADADGATPIREEAALRRAIDAGADLAVGSRILTAAGVVQSRAWHRGLVGRCFAAVASAALGLGVRDPQCGFKMLRRDPGRRLCRACREDGFLFDAELLARAYRAEMRVAEVPVCWTEVPGSKVRPVRDGWRMLRGIPRVRRAVAAVPAHPLPAPARVAEV